jgi:hypothetical protein
MEVTMSTTNPLADNAPTDPEDLVLVLRARSGDHANTPVAPELRYTCVY